MSEAAGHDVRKLAAMFNARRAEVADRIIDPGTKANNAMHTEPPIARFQMESLPRRPGDGRRYLAKIAAIAETQVAMKARSFLRPLLAVASVLCFVASFVPFILGSYLAMAVSGGEYHELMANDRPKSYSSLAFGAWQTGSGQLSRSHIVNLPTDSVIARHRVGRDSNLLNTFTYYEAEYVLSGGTKRVTHASGPVPMFTARPSAVYGGLGVGWLLALVFALISFKLGATANRVVAVQAK